MAVAAEASVPGRDATVWRTLAAALASLSEHPTPERTRAGAPVARRGPGLDILDAGGGSGGFAVPLAVAGHRVVVVDPSPDSLASLQRRAREHQVASTVRGLQGDLANLAALLPPGSVDVVLCHSVLEVVDDPAVALANVATVLRRDGVLSVLVATWGGAVLGRALAGQLGEVARLLASPPEVSPRPPVSPDAPRRFDRAGLCRSLDAAGLDVVTVRGVRILTDLLPVGTPDADPTTGTGVRELEEAAALRAEFHDVAAQLHVLARRR